MFSSPLKIGRTFTNWLINNSYVSTCNIHPLSSYRCSQQRSPINGCIHALLLPRLNYPLMPASAEEIKLLRTFVHPNHTPTIAFSQWTQVVRTHGDTGHQDCTLQWSPHGPRVPQLRATLNHGRPPLVGRVVMMAAILRDYTAF